VAAAKSVGFLYVTADLEGYRTGSMNAVLPESAKRRG
jgi:PP-loop superfamily ATP-utilizing enzyme